MEQQRPRTTSARVVCGRVLGSGYAITENTTPLGTTHPRQPVEVLVSRSVSTLPSSPDRPFLTVEEAAAVLGISRTLAYSLANEFLTTRSGLSVRPSRESPHRLPRAALERWTNADLVNPNDAA